MRKIALLAIAIGVFTATLTSTHTVSAQTNEGQTKPSATVKVVEGDSLSAIAEKNQTTWVRIFNANEAVANPDIINPGMELRIPSPDEQLPERPLPQPVVAAAPAPIAQPVAVASSYGTQASTYRAPASVQKPAPAQTSYPVSSNAAKAFIYNKESGNNPNATNPNGCYGIGQDCNGVLRAQCGADYACQDAYFNGYAERRYGGWENARQFWLANGWW